MTFSTELREALGAISTATLSNILFKRGYTNCWIRGSLPLGDKQHRVVGPAFTLRFVPARPDLLAATSPKFVSVRVAIEEIPEGAIAVIDAMGFVDGGTVGDIMTLRMAKKKVAALVTDGVIRDISGVKQSGLAVWSRGTAAPPAAVALAFAGWQEIIACGGVAVQPSDIIVADDDGAVVIPAEIAGEVAAEALKADHLEAWIVQQVENGTALPGLYPPDAATLARYKLEIDG